MICYELQIQQISTQMGDLGVSVLGVILVFVKSWLSENQGKQERGHCLEHR